MRPSIGPFRADEQDPNANQGTTIPPKDPTTLEEPAKPEPNPGLGGDPVKKKSKPKGKR
jgi:hypothetical protein